MNAADLFPLRHEVRAGLLKAVSTLPDEHVEWKPAVAPHSILAWLWHIAEVEDWWIQAVVREQPGFTARRRPRWADLAGALEYLHATRAATERCLAELPADALAEERLVPRRGAVTLQEVFCRVFDHEVHHRAQIFLYLRLMGLEPPPA